MFISLVGVLIVLRSTVFYGFFLLAAQNLHKKMFNCVILAKSRFFDINPLGRLMNRFAKDVGNVDDMMPFVVFDFFQVTFASISMAKIN